MCAKSAEKRTLDDAEKCCTADSERDDDRMSAIPLGTLVCDSKGFAGSFNCQFDCVRASPLWCAERATFIAGISVIEALCLPTQHIMAFLTCFLSILPSDFNELCIKFCLQ